MLEDTDRIDMIARTPRGDLELIITDCGITTNNRARFDLLVSKLRTYVGYIVSDEFTRENGNSALATSPFVSLRLLLQQHK